MTGAVWTGHDLAIDFLLERDEGVQQSFWPRRTTRNMDIDWDISINAFKDVIPLLEGAARNGRV